MAEPHPSPPSPASRPASEPAVATRERQGVDWRHVGRRAVVWLVLAVLALLLLLLLAAFVPRWWGQRVGGLVGGEFSLGAWWGLFAGAVFTGLPLLAAWHAVLPGRSWEVRVGLGVLALLLATPNLLTLAVVLGTNSAADAGRRILDADAPGFRGATGWGAVIGVVVVVAITLLVRGYRRRGRRLKAIEEATRSS